jgi:hypothetical protein
MADSASMDAGALRALIAKDLGVCFSFPCFVTGADQNSGTYARCMLETRGDLGEDEPHPCAARTKIDGAVSAEEGRLQGDIEELIVKVILKPAHGADEARPSSEQQPRGPGRGSSPRTQVQ